MPNETPTPSSESKSSSSRLVEAVDDAQILLSYSAESGLDVANEATRTIATASEQLTSGDLSAEQETNFWSAFNTLSKAVSPVTVSSLRSTMDSYAPITTRYGRRVRRSEARKAVGFYTVIAIVTLVPLLLLQIYWLFGAAVTNDISHVRKELDVVEQEMNKLKLSVPPTKPARPELAAAAEGERMNNLKATQISLMEQKAVNYELLKTWGRPWEWLVPRPVGQSGNPIGENNARIRTAPIVLDILQRYFLPLFYGLLGSCVYILRTLSAEIRSRTYSEGSNIGFQIRLYLGMLGGMVIAWFVVPDASDGLFKSLSPFALAFLAGYSVELLFSAMDKLLSAFTSKT